MNIMNIMNLMNNVNSQYSCIINNAAKQTVINFQN